MLNSDMYEFSKYYIDHSPRIAQELGKVRSKRLGFTNLQSGYGAGVWSGKFHVVLTGEKGNGTLYLELQSVGTEWQVVAEDLVLEK
jgi:hypothetical protein